MEVSKNEWDLVSMELGKAWIYKKKKLFAELLEKYSWTSPEATLLMMGLCYQHGWGVKKDQDKAKTYFLCMHKGMDVYFGHSASTECMVKCRVLDVQADRVLLQSTILYQIPLNYGRNLLFPPKQWVTWDHSLIRKWLNDGFLKEVFTKQEQDVIIKTEVITPDNPFCESKVKVKDTEDKVFLLSLQEYMEYHDLQPDSAKRVTWTFTKKQGRVTDEYLLTEYSNDQNVLFFGKDIKSESFDGKIGSYFRTPGKSAAKRCFAIGDSIFYEGEKGGQITFSHVPIAYAPAFWVSLE